MLDFDNIIGFLAFSGAMSQGKVAKFEMIWWESKSGWLDFDESNEWSEQWIMLRRD